MIKVRFWAFVLILATIASPTFALTCEDEITRLTGICIQQIGLDNAKTCRQQSTARLGDCRNWKGEMADFTGAAEAGRNPGNVYMSCDEKKRMGYILEKYEVDYCGGLPRRE